MLEEKVHTAVGSSKVVKLAYEAVINRCLG
jgi:hypothetical protein